MLTTSCPKCEKEVTIPFGAQAASRVRCPLCSEEYTLEGVFEKLPPMLVLLDAPRVNGLAARAEAEEPRERGMFDFESGLASAAASGEKLDDGGDIALADAPQTAAKTSSFDFGPESPSAAATLATAAAARSAARPRRKVQGAMWKQIVGIVVGGLVAAPIAQMILMWMPGNWQRQQRDPLGLGPSIASVIPWIVPQHLRTEEGAAASQQPAPAAVAQRPVQGGSPPANGTASGGNKTTNPPGGSLSRPDLDEALKQPGEKPNNPPRGSDSSGTEGPANADPGSTDPSGQDNPLTNPDPPETDPPTTDVPPPEAEGPPLGPKNAPKFTAEALLKEIKAAAEAKGLINIAARPDGDGKLKRESAESFMATMNALAHVVTFAADRPTGHVEHLQDILASAGDLPKKRKIIGTMAAAELDSQQRSASGLVIAGTVLEIQPRGQLFEAVIELDSQAKRPVSVYGKSNPAGAFNVGDTVIILGEIIDQPNQKLAGYKGPDEPVIWGGFSQVVTPQ